MNIDWIAWLPSVTVISIAVMLGWVLEKVVMAGLRRWIDAHFSNRRDLVGAFAGMAFVWCLLAGLMIADGLSPMAPPHQELLRSGLRIAWILSATVVVMRLTGRLVSLPTQQAQGAASVSLLANAARVAVLIVGLLVAFESLGVSIAPVLTALGVGGLAVALALQPTLSNLFSGFQLVASNKVRPGDFVRLDSGEEGFVNDINWRDTSLRTLGNNLVVIPNAKLAEARVTNLTLPMSEIVLLVPVGVAYVSDLDQVERVTVEVATQIQRSVAGAVVEHVPVVMYNRLNDFSIDFNVVLKVQGAADQAIVRHAFIKALVARYREENIAIPFPTRTLISDSGKPA